jgi:hypothetical protein
MEDTKVLREFLQEQQSSRQSPCLTEAIKQLGQLRDVHAIRLLIGYLDYVEPGTGPLLNGGATIRPRYPAVDALFRIGKPATVELLSAIQAGKSPQIVTNAVRAYEDVYRDDLWDGVRGLKTAEILAKTDDERRRLNDARQELMRACNARDEKESQECQNAAGG